MDRRRRVSCGVDRRHQWKDRSDVEWCDDDVDLRQSVS